MRAAQSGLGTGRDAIARDSLRRARLSVQKAHATVSPLLTDAALSELVRQYNKAKAEFDSLNAATLRREKEVFRKNAEEAQTPQTSQQNSASERTALTQAHVRDFKQVDLSGLRTEEHLQAEKLRSAREVETDMQDLKTTYQEFSSLVDKQQEGLDYVTNNVSETNNLIDKGHGQLQSASRSQKRFRKFGCAIGIVVIVVVIAVIIAVVVVTR